MHVENGQWNKRSHSLLQSLEELPKDRHDNLCSDLLYAKPFRSQSTEHGITYKPVAMRKYQK